MSKVGAPTPGPEHTKPEPTSPAPLAIDGLERFAPPRLEHARERIEAIVLDGLRAHMAEAYRTEPTPEQEEALLRAIGAQLDRTLAQLLN